MMREAEAQRLIAVGVASDCEDALAASLPNAPQDPLVRDLVWSGESVDTAE